MIFGEGTFGQTTFATTTDEAVDLSLQLLGQGWM
jgi:hypothetical protein